MIRTCVFKNISHVDILFISPVDEQKFIFSLYLSFCLEYVVASNYFLLFHRSCRLISYVTNNFSSSKTLFLLEELKLIWMNIKRTFSINSNKLSQLSYLDQSREFAWSPIEQISTCVIPFIIKFGIMCMCRRHWLNLLISISSSFTSSHTIRIFSRRCLI